MRYQFGISAINWVNEDVLSVGDHYTCDQVLSEMSQLGFKGTENSRKFPKSAAELNSKLAQYGLVLTSQWKSVMFSQPELLEEELTAFCKHADFLHETGCRHAVVCEVSYGFSDPRADERGRQLELDEQQWEYLIHGLHEAGRYCQQLGIKLVYHYHAETVIEGPQAIQRLMDSTDSALVHLLFDSGHAYYGGIDPLELLHTYYDRIAYIHLKDVREHVRQWKQEGAISFTDAVIEGLFTVPGDGCIDFAPIMQELNARGYDGWIIIEAEQDPTKANPVAYANLAKQYLSIR